MANLSQSICTTYTIQELELSVELNLHPVTYTGFHLQYLMSRHPKPGRPSFYVRAILHGGEAVFLSSVWWDRTCLLRDSIGRIEVGGIMYDLIQRDDSTWEVVELGLKRQKKFPLYNNGEIRKLSFQSGNSMRRK